MTTEEQLNDNLDALGDAIKDMKVETIDITPEWENTLEWMAVNMAQHGFLVNSYTAMASILDIARYLARSGEENQAKLDRIIESLEARR